jgi:simple sugar transport system permease protein
VPSFLVTLGTLFVLRGLTIALSRAAHGPHADRRPRRVPGYDTWRPLLAGDLGAFRISVLWWLALVLLATWLLRRTRGRQLDLRGRRRRRCRTQCRRARCARVKVALFVTTASPPALVGVMQAVRFTGADALRGEGQEFRAIIAVVIGGTLLTGGYGSAVGALLGALIFGMVQQGIVITGADADWFQVFLGAMLIGAVLVNDWTRRRARA